MGLTPESRSVFYFKINYSDPIPVTTFTLGVSSFETLYLELNQNSNEVSVAHELCISSIKSGSIEIDFTVLGPGLFATAEALKNASAYIALIKRIITFIKKRNSREISNAFSSTVLGNFNNILQISAPDSKGAQIIGTKIENQNIYISSEEAKNFSKKLIEAIAIQKQPSANRYEKVAMYFKKTSDRVRRHGSGDRVVIESISLKNTRVDFSNSQIKAQILAIPGNIFKKAFIVDVHVETIGGEPVLYNVHRLHYIEDRPDSLPPKIRKSRMIRKS